MANNVLLSGPAGAGKSAYAKSLMALAEGPVVQADFQSLYVAISGDERLPDGRYPPRDERLLPTVEHLRQTLITSAVERDIEVIATNSDGSPERRAYLLGLLGVGATETVVDPGRVTVEARLSDPVTFELSDDCREAVNRWYTRIE